MTVIEIFTLIATLAGAAKDLGEVYEILQKSGLKQDDLIPPEHLARIQQILCQVNPEWDVNHDGDNFA